MAVALTNIKGMTASIAEGLKNTARIDSLKAFADATNTADERAALAKKLGESPAILYFLAKQAELLRCEAIEPGDADILVRAGVRCIADLKACDPEKLANFIFDQKLDEQIDEYHALDWIAAAVGINSNFEPDASDVENTVLKLSRTSLSSGYGHNTGMAYSSAYSSDLSDVITELGVGIAQAQRQLDQMSIDIQKEIFSNPDFAEYGMNATWYAIPEATFTLKMEYSFSEEGSKQMKIVPMNAAYNNIFKTERSEESTLTLRFVPVPPPEAMTRRVTMPSLEGLTRAEADEVLSELGITPEYSLISGIPSNGKASEIVRQSVSADTLLAPMQHPVLFYKETESERMNLIEQLVSVLTQRKAQLNAKTTKDN